MSLRCRALQPQVQTWVVVQVNGLRHSCRLNIPPGCVECLEGRTYEGSIYSLEILWQVSGGMCGSRTLTLIRSHGNVWGEVWWWGAPCPAIRDMRTSYDPLHGTSQWSWLVSRSCNECRLNFTVLHDFTRLTTAVRPHQGQGKSKPSWQDSKVKAMKENVWPSTQSNTTVSPSHGTYICHVRICSVKILIGMDTLSLSISLSLSLSHTHTYKHTHTLKRGGYYNDQNLAAEMF